MFRKKIYAWHRTTSLIIAIPVLLWAASGFMHPLMTNIKPQVATQKLPPVAIDTSAIHVPLKAALQKNNITAFHSVRLIHIDTNFFYQVQQQVNKAPVYLSTVNGKLLPSGDWLYAQYLARQFLEGPVQRAPAATATASYVSEEEGAGYDCCNAATNCVLKNTTGSTVANASRLTAFNDEYKYVNRLLPVYKVAFNRPDGIRVYVETTQDRFAFAMDNKRAVFDNIFQLLHTWSWLDALGNTKLVFIIAITILAFCTTLMGLYIFFTTKTKKANGHAVLKARRNHRYTAIVGALFTLAWTFSGAWHAFAKFKPDNRDAFYISNQFPATIDLDIARLQQVINKPVSNVSLVKMDDQAWWRVTNMETPAIALVNANDYTVLPKGEEKYAAWLAGQFSKNATTSIQSVTAVTKFNDEYNFADKRLPVWRVSYSGKDNARYFVETSTSRLSTRVDNSEMAEGFSFALLHKHHFMDWGGKETRDASTMVWAMFQVVMILVGLMLWWKRRR
jgi:uncharacterized iron-regulated membrane protein